MPKAKGTPGGNPNPVQNDTLKAKRFNRADQNEMPLDNCTTGVRLYAEDGEIVRSQLSDSQARAAWLRRVIHAAVVAELRPLQQAGD